MNEKRIRKAIETGRLPLRAVDIAGIVLASALALFVWLAILGTMIKKGFDPVLIMFGLVFFFAALYPLLFRQKLTPYMSQRPESEKLQVIKALDKRENSYWYRWFSSTSNANFYSFYYKANWWGYPYLVSIIYTDTGYFISSFQPRGLGIKRAEVTDQIINDIKELEAEI